MVFILVNIENVSGKYEFILQASKFDHEDKDHIFSVIDAFIAKRKIQSIL